MPESLNLYEPLLVNSIGHSAGAVVFGLLLVLLLRDTWARRSALPRLPLLAALLAFVWNVGSLVALSPSSSGTVLASAAAAVSFASLSILPALLLAISLKGGAPWLRAAGWMASGCAVLLHFAETLMHEARLHSFGLLLIAVVFGILAILSIWRVHTGIERRRLVSGVLVPVALILFAGSFVHFGEAHTGHPWSQEIALHHAGIPLALFIVLQDYRFLLMDTFLRALASAGLAALLTLSCLAANERWRLLTRSAEDPFFAGLIVTAACCSLVAFAFLRGLLQTWLTRSVFRRPSLHSAITRIVERPTVGTERDLLESAAQVISDHIGSERLELREAQHPSTELFLPEAVTAGDGILSREDAWVNVVVPLRFSRGDSFLLLLGRRIGGRRYLSEDLRELSQLALVVTSQVERFRSERVEQLATEAELRALHAQINPHFLFNSLNALYGTIPRQAEGARRTVLNLADIFRYFLQTDRSTIPLSEEIRIVKAYLEIEQLRLGERLQVEVIVDPDAMTVPVPPLCIQPIVENGIKHGIACKPGPGSLRLRVARYTDRIEVEVCDTGDGFRTSEEPAKGGRGVGLDNVRQRLRMMYGALSELRIQRTVEGTSVQFAVPLCDDATNAPARLPAQVARG